MTTVPAHLDDLCDRRAATADSPSISEQRLIERARRDAQAFAELYHLHYEAIINYLYRRTGEVSLSEDLTADVFMAAMQKIATFECRGTPIRFWLLRIATNKANRFHRKQRRRRIIRELFSQEVNLKPVSDDARSDSDQMMQAFNRLSAPHQTVLALHYLQGLTIEQVARVLKCRPGTVKSRLARARASLEQMLNRSIKSEQ